MRFDARRDTSIVIILIAARHISESDLLLICPPYGEPILTRCVYFSTSGISCSSKSLHTAHGIEDIRNYIPTTVPQGRCFYVSQHKPVSNV